MADNKIPLAGGILLAAMSGLSLRSALQSWGVPMPSLSVPHVEPIISLGLAAASGYVAYRLITSQSNKRML